jgi:hypothetical protein
MNDWSKDFIEHLRTVHFTLVTICLTLVIITSSTRRFEYSKAHDQIAVLRDMPQKTINDTLQTVWFNRFKQERIVNLPKQTDDQPEDLRNLQKCKSQPSCRPVDNNLAVRLGTISIRLAIDKGGLFRDTDGSEAVWKKSRLDTLSGISTFWESLQRGVSIKLIATLTPVGGSIDGKQEKLDWIPPENVDSVDSKVALVFDPEQSDRGHTTLSGRAPLNGQTVELTFDAVTTKERISLDDFAAADSSHFFQSGAFKDEFPEAVRFVTNRNLGGRGFDEVMKELASAEDKVDNPATVFGFLVPSEVVAPWGLVLLIGVQLYFWIHLCEITDKIQDGSPGWSVAWVGIYDSEPAKTVSKLSVSAGPLGTTLILVVLEIMRGSDSISNAEATVMILATAASIWLASLTYRQFERLQRKRSLAPVERAEADSGPGAETPIPKTH